MPDINLLQNQLNTDSTYRFKKYFDKIQFGLILVIALIFMFGGGLVVWNYFAQKHQARASQEIEQRKVRLASTISEKRDSVVKAQAQIKNLDDLLGNHLYWSGILDLVTGATIEGIQFVQLTGNADGQILLGGLARDFTTLAGFTKRLNDIEGIRQVIINSTSLSETTDSTFYNFNVTINFEPWLLKFQNEE